MGDVKGAMSCRQSQSHERVFVTAIYAPTSNMDSLGPIDDEVIADSEGEIEEEEHPGNPGALITATPILIAY